MNSTVSERVALIQQASDAATAVFTTIITRSPISRIDVARATGLSQAAVTKAVAPLIAAGIVADRQAVPRATGPGRPANPLAIVPDALLLMGIKVNVDEVIGVVTDLTNTLVAAVRRPLHSHETDVAVAIITEVHDRLVEETAEAADRIAGIGVAISGDVDATAGVVRESGLMNWADVPLARLLGHLSAPVTLTNDVHALTIGEHWFGAGAGTESFAIVTIGRGIGAGLHLNGEVVEGAQGVSGEIGHLPLGRPDRLCACGRYGCVEAVASTTAVLEDISTHLGREVALDEAVALARSDHDGALTAFRTAGAVVGTAIASLVNLTGPEVVLIGGEAVEHFDLLEEPLLAAFRARAFGAAVQCRITARPHTFEDWARGAAITALQRIVRDGR